MYLNSLSTKQYQREISVFFFRKITKHQVTPPANNNKLEASEGRMSVVLVLVMDLRKIKMNLNLEPVDVLPPAKREYIFIALDTIAIQNNKTCQRMK